MTSNKITVIGVGRLGICVSLCLEKYGYDVVAVDVIPSYVDQLNAKTFVSDEPKVSDLLKASKNFKATCSLEDGLNHSDVIFIFVDTPSTGIARMERTYDTSRVSAVLEQINTSRVRGKHIVIGSTVYMGYVEQVANDILSDCPNTSISYNPEFIAQGDIIRGFLYPDLVLIGEGSQEAGDVLQSIYEKVTQNTPPVCRMSPISAEICKLANNCFVTTKISFANMIGDIADRTVGAEKTDILQAVGAHTGIGLKCLNAGWGYGGPCLPRDNRALALYGESIGVNATIPEATDRYNHLHADYLCEEMLKLYPQDPIVLENVTYKESCAVPIIEESHKLLVGLELLRRGRKVLIRDRPAVIDAVKLEYGSRFQYEVKPEQQ